MADPETVKEPEQDAEPERIDLAEVRGVAFAISEEVADSPSAALLRARTLHDWLASALADGRVIDAEKDECQRVVDALISKAEKAKQEEWIATQSAKLDPAWMQRGVQGTTAPETPSAILTRAIEVADMPPVPLPAVDAEIPTPNLDFELPKDAYVPPPEPPPTAEEIAAQAALPNWRNGPVGSARKWVRTDLGWSGGGPIKIAMCPSCMFFVQDGPNGLCNSAVPEVVRQNPAQKTCNNARRRDGV